MSEADKSRLINNINIWLTVKDLELDRSANPLALDNKPIFISVIDYLRSACDRKSTESAIQIIKREIGYNSFTSLDDKQIDLFRAFLIDFEATSISKKVSAFEVVHIIENHVKEYQQDQAKKSTPSSKNADDDDEPQPEHPSSSSHQHVSRPPLSQPLARSQSYRPSEAEAPRSKEQISKLASSLPSPSAEKKTI